MDVREIDRFLTQEEASAPATWLPASVRAILSEDAVANNFAGTAFPHGGQHRPDAQAPAHASFPRPRLAPADHARDTTHDSQAVVGRSGPVTQYALSNGSELTKESYGTSDPPPRAMHQLEVLNPRYKRIEQVVIGIGLAFAVIFGCALTTGGPVNDNDTIYPGQEQKLTEVSGFGCGSFMCPHSGSCVMEARSCPEGNPFMRRSGIYHELINCAGPGLCDCKSNPDAEHLCKQGVVGFSALNAWGTKPGAGCGGFLCPGSGVCRRAPADCEEGSPFVRKDSVYLREALAAQKKLEVQRRAGDKVRRRAEAAKLKEKEQAQLRAEDTSNRKKSNEELASAPLLQEASKILASEQHGTSKHREGKVAHAGKTADGSAERQAEAERVMKYQERALARSIDKSNAALAAAIFQHEHAGAS